MTTKRTTDDSLADTALEKLSAFLRALYRALESAITTTKTGFFADRPHDPFLFAHQVRYLTALQIDALPKSDLDCSRVELPMSGLEWAYNGCRIKVWKSGEGELPAPGRSVTRQDFVTQPEIPGLLGPAQVPPRFVVLWRLDVNQSLAGLDLACPKDFDKPWESGVCHFVTAVPHPAEELSPRVELATESYDIEELELVRKKAGSKDLGHDD